MAGIITFKPVLYSQYRRADGSYFVRIRITANRKSKFLVTNIAVTDKQLTRSLKIKDASVTDAINDLVARLRKAASSLDPFSVSQMSIDGIVQYLSLRQDGAFRLDFFKFAERIIEEKEKDETKALYRKALKSFMKFWGKSEMDISEIKSTTLRQYEAWMGKTVGKGAASIKLYTCALGYIHRRARETYNSEELGDILIKNPFAYYKPAKTLGTKHRNVSAETIQKVIDGRTTLKKKDEIYACDLFIISFAMMGLNLADIYDAPPPKDDVLIYHRRKTRDRRDDKAEMHVKIDPRIRPLYEQYRDPEGKYAFIHRCERLQSLRMLVSRALASAAGKLGIEEPMTFYSARHTWATLAYSIGIDKSVINDCLCHIDNEMKVTDIYIERDWRILWEANKKVLDLFDWSKI